MRSFFLFFSISFVFVNTSPALGQPGERAPLRVKTAGESPQKLLARYFANKIAMKQNAAKLAELHKDIEDTFAEIRKLRMAKKPDKDQGQCEVCVDVAEDFCNRPALYPEFCRDGDCRMELEPKRNICQRIFQNESCYKALNAAARAKVNDCWLVDNYLTAGELEVEIDNIKKQMSDIEQEQLDLRKVELQLEAECPRCPKARVPAHTLDPDADEGAPAAEE